MALFKRFVYLSGVLLLSVILPKGHGECVKLCGTIRSQIFWPGRGDTFRFEILVGSNKWIIRDYQSDNACGWDGTNVYNITYNAPIVQPNQSIIKSNISCASITRGPLPTGAVNSQVSVLWLAYLSGAYLVTNHDNRLPAPWHVDPPALKRAFRCDIRKSEMPPFLPQDVLFKASSQLWKSESRRVGIAHEKPRFNDGFVAGAYQVTAWTNSFGLTIPSSFTLTSFFAGPNGGKMGDRAGATSEVYSATLTSISVVESCECVPEIRQDTSVQDFRFVDQHYPTLIIPYPITNKIWLDENSPAVLRMVDFYKKNDVLFMAAARRGRIVKWLVLSCSGLLLTLTAYWVLLRLIPSRERN